MSFQQFDLLVIVRSIGGLSVGKPLFNLVNTAVKGILVNSRELLLELANPNLKTASA